VNAYIHNCCLSKFGKSNDSVLELSRKTCEESLVGIDRKIIDSLIFSSFAPEVYTKEFHLASKLADSLHLSKDIFCIKTETASSSGASALHTAYYLLQSGAYKNIIICGTEVMSKLDREENNILLGSVLSENQKRFSMSMAQGAAMITNLYLKNYGYKKEDLFHIAFKLHTNGFNNAKAHLKKIITWEDYCKSPIFASPLGLYDISPLSDGSASLVLSSEIKSNLIIKGVGNGRSSFYITGAEPSFSASIQAFHKAYKSANIKPEDIAVAELHDAFTPFELIGSEDAGLFKKGEALKMVMEGVTNIDNRLPINPSGGLKTRGHPIGASGLAQIVELANFMNKNNKPIGLAHSIGGLATNNFATILEKIS
jgi:acetyl-CoA acetyltransferase